MWSACSLMRARTRACTTARTTATRSAGRSSSERPEVVRILKDHAAREEDSAGAPPDTLLQTLRAFQESRVILTAIELDVFSAVSAGTGTTQDVATRIGAAARATEMLLNTQSGFVLPGSHGSSTCGSRVRPGS